MSGVQDTTRDYVVVERADEADVGVAYDFRTHVEKTLQKDGDVAIDKLVDGLGAVQQSTMEQLRYHYSSNKVVVSFSHIRIGGMSVMHEYAPEAVQRKGGNGT